MAHVAETLGEFLGFADIMNRQEAADRAHQPRWSPAAFLRASAALHVCAAGTVVARPQAWPWALGAVAANHLALAAAGLWPRSQLLGPNWIRLPAGNGRSPGVAITIDDGPDPDVTPGVLAQLAQHQAQATFFCVGELVERHPELAQDIVRQGHHIENHSQRHRHDFSLMGPRGMAAEIAEAQASIARVTGTSPLFFRAPAGLRNPFLDPILVHLQLRLASWTRRGFDTVRADADAVFRRLTTRLQEGDILLLHDGHAARSRAGNPVILEVLPRLLALLAEKQLRPVTLRSAL